MHDSANDGGDDGDGVWNGLDWSVPDTEIRHPARPLLRPVRRPPPMQNSCNLVDGGRNEYWWDTSCRQWRSLDGQTNKVLVLNEVNL